MIVIGPFVAIALVAAATAEWRRTSASASL
jgi:hypothetical protein